MIKRKKSAKRKISKKKVKKKKTVQKRVTKKKTRKGKPSKKVTVKKGGKSPKLSAPYPAIQIVGKISHYFPHVAAGVIKLKGALTNGDVIHIKGHTTDIKQTVGSLQIDHVPVTEARKGQEIGLEVKGRVRIGDIVYKL